MNVELKPYADTTATAEAAAEALEGRGREKDVIVNAFSQAMIEAFHTAAPNHLALGGSLEKTTSYITGQPITPTPVAVQPPDRYDLDPGPGTNIVDTLPLLRPHFEYDGFIAVVWPSDKDETQETDPWYQKLIDQGAGAINTMFPSRLHKYLCETGVPAADGGLRCAQQQCPGGYTGFAPKCEKIPVCAEGTTGTPPNCTPVVIPTTPDAKVSKLTLAPKKGKIKAGKKKTLTLSVTASTGKSVRVTIRLKSSNRKVKVPARLTVTLAPGKTVKKKFTVSAARKAKGKVKITATAGGVKAAVNHEVNPLYSAGGHQAENPLAR